MEQINITSNNKKSLDIAIIIVGICFILSIVSIWFYIFYTSIIGVYGYQTLFYITFDIIVRAVWRYIVYIFFPSAIVLPVLLFRKQAASRIAWVVIVLTALTIAAAFYFWGSHLSFSM